MANAIANLAVPELGSPPPSLRLRQPSPRTACRAEAVSSEGWRPRPELNRGTRICSPLRHHSATWPSGAWLYRTRSRLDNTAQITRHACLLPGLAAKSRAVRKPSRVTHDRLCRRAPHDGGRPGPDRRRDRSAASRRHARRAARAVLSRGQGFARLSRPRRCGERDRPAGPPPAQADGAGEAHSGRRARRNRPRARCRLRHRLFDRGAGQACRIRWSGSRRRRASPARRPPCWPKRASPTPRS